MVTEFWFLEDLETFSYLRLHLFPIASESLIVDVALLLHIWIAATPRARRGIVMNSLVYIVGSI